MLRKIWILATLLAAVCLSSTAQADVFVTSQVTVNSQNLDGGTGPITDVRSFGLAATGISYTNFQGLVNGVPVVTAVGFVPLSGTANVGLTSPSFGTNGNQLVGVYALQGVLTDDSPLTASFHTGFVTIYDRGDPTSAPNFQDPSTWLGTPVAQFALNNTSISDVIQGGVIPNNDYEDPATGDLSNLNSAIADASALLGTQADFLFSLLAQNDILLDGEEPGSLAFLVSLSQKLIQPPVGSDSDSLVAALNAIFDAYFGTTDGFAFGVGMTDYTPVAFGGSSPANGDTVQQNIGGLVTPGVITPATEIPEPASLIVWSVMAAGGAGLGMIRRRRNQQA